MEDAKNNQLIFIIFRKFFIESVIVTKNRTFSVFKENFSNYVKIGRKVFLEVKV